MFSDVEGWRYLWIEKHRTYLVPNRSFRVYTLHPTWTLFECSRHCNFQLLSKPTPHWWHRAIMKLIFFLRAMDSKTFGIQWNGRTWNSRNFSKIVDFSSDLHSKCLQSLWRTENEVISAKTYGRIKVMHVPVFFINV